MPALPGAVADWIGRLTGGDHEGQYFDLVSRAYCTTTRATPKTIYDPLTGKIHDVRAGYLAANPWAAYVAGGVGVAPVIEEARTNAFLRSYILGATEMAAWTADAGLTATAGASAHGLYNSAVGAVLTADASNRAFWQTLTATAATWVVSAYVRKTGGAAVTADDCQLCAVAGTTTPVGTLLTTTFTPLTGGWYRMHATFTGTAASWAVGVAVKAGKAVMVDCLATGAGAFPTSYIPTTTAAATRNADVAAVPTTGWNAAAGTWVGIAVAPPNVTSGPAIATWYADGDNRIYMDTVTANKVRIYAEGQNSAAQPEVVAGASPYVHAVTYIGGGSSVAYYNGSPSIAVSGYLTATGLPAMARIGSLGEPTAKYHNAPIHRVPIFADAKNAATVAGYNYLVNGAKATSGNAKKMLPI